MAIPDIIDNKNYKLADAVNEQLEISNFSAMCVGYFHLSGFHQIQEKLSQVKELRILIGNQTDQDTLDELMLGFTQLDLASKAKDKQEFINKKQILNKLKISQESYINQIESLEQTNEQESSIKSLAELISQEKVKINVYPLGKLHSKAYIFEFDEKHRQTSDGVVIAGSSNLSYSGLSHNSELNFVLRDSKQYQEIVAWFERLWADSKPFNIELLDVIKKSWVVKLLPPYLFYLYTLYQIVKDRFNDDGLPKYLPVDDFPPLKPFQERAFKRAINIIEQNNGVLIADVVGFGKSYIGSALIRYFFDKYRMKSLIICPATLVNMWEEYKEEFNLRAKVLSIGKLQQENFNVDAFLGDYSDECDVVLIDESHNFRYPNTIKYQNIQEFLKGKKVILLSATPQNKTIWDYYHQIKLFTYLDSDHRFPIMPKNIKEFFKKAEVAEQPQDIYELLQHILIRRRRKDLENEEDVTFPDRKLDTKTYIIEKVYPGNLYIELLDFIKVKFKYSRYKPSEYLKPDVFVKKKYEQLNRLGFQVRGLLKALLLKRTESSIAAITNTLTKIKNSCIAFKKGLEKGIMLIGEQFDELLRSTDNIEDLDSLLDEMNFEKNPSLYDANDFEVENLSKDLEFDINLLEELILKLIQTLASDNDDKINELQKVITQNTGKKILIFSEYESTIQYLFKKLKAKSLKGKTESDSQSEGLTKDNQFIAYLAGSNRKLLLNYIRKFAPKANLKKGKLDDGEIGIDILLSTDILSEGQNLQDAEILINYDIHWNPVKLIQRVGRIDRLGSENEQIFVNNFLPAKEIECELGLQERVHQRIQEIHDVLGEDNYILTKNELLNSKAMYSIANNDEEILEQPISKLDVTSTLESIESFLRKLKKEKPEIFSQIEQFQTGQRTIYEGQQAGTFVLFEAEGNLIQPYWIPKEQKTLLQDTVNTDVSKIIKFIECDENKKLPGQNPKLSKEHNQILQKIRKLYEVQLSQPAAVNARKDVISYIRKQLEKLYSETKNEVLKHDIDVINSAFVGELPAWIVRKFAWMRKKKLTGELLLRYVKDVYNIEDLAQYSQRKITTLDIPKIKIIASAEIVKPKF